MKGNEEEEDMGCSSLQYIWTIWMWSRLAFEQEDLNIENGSKFVGVNKNRDLEWPGSIIEFISWLGN